MASTLNLQPLTIGDILDRAVQLYRRNFLRLAAICVILNVSILLIQILPGLLLLLPSLVSGDLLRRGADVASLAWLCGGLAAAGLGIVLWIFEMGALSSAFAEYYFGRTMTIRQSLRAARLHWLSLLGAISLIVAYNLAATIVLLIPLLISFFCLSCFGFIAIPSLFLAANTPWTYTIQAIMLEDRGARAGMGRSWKLVRGSFLRVFVTNVCFLLFIIAMTLPPTLVIQFSILALFNSAGLQATVLSGVAGTLIGALITPIQFAILTVMYYDLRVRKEGFDLELRAKQITEQATSVA